MTTINKFNENQGVNSTDKTITLINGTTLVCYPKAERPDSIKEDQLKLDTTGEYLSIGKGKTFQKAREERNKMERQELEFFLDHAFYFYKNADRIFKDSRMFLSPVPVRSGLAYIGTNGLNRPTLGIYLEWWIYCKGDITHDQEGNDALTYYIAGSPLSGSNSCSCVYPDGKTIVIHHDSFSTVWSSLATINKRYTEAKQRYEAYTLQEVWDILSSTEQSEASKLATQLMIQEGKVAAKVATLNEKILRLSSYNNELYKRLKQVCIKLYHKDLETFREEYKKTKQEVDNEITALMEQRRELKSQLKKGVLDNVTYQKLLHPLNQKRDSFKHQLWAFKEKNIERLTENGDLTRSIIEDYLYN